jgi:AraC-like DNA-binding protein
MDPSHSASLDAAPGTAVRGAEFWSISSERLVSSELLQLSTDDVRGVERVDFWREMVLRLFADVEIASKVSDGFYGRMQSRYGNDVRFTVVDAASQAVQRRHREARERYEDCYFAVLMLSGTQWMEQDGREALLGAGDFAIYDGSRPHRLTFSRQWGEIILNIPRDTLHHLLPGTERLTATRVGYDSALGSVLQGFLGSMAREIHRLDPGQLGTLTEHAVGLIATTLAGRVGDDGALSRHRGATLARIKAFVEQHLDDPELDAARIAAELRLSPRYLNKLFEAEHTSLMRYVWRRRLERCRADLLDAAHAGARIGDIAMRWGFNDLSHFSRAFRERFGQAPRDLRRQQGTQRNRG